MHNIHNIHNIYNNKSGACAGSTGTTTTIIFSTIITTTRGTKFIHSFLTVINIINLWLAGRVVKLSGRLRRPWPDLAAMRLPPATPVILAVAVLLCFLPGLLGIIAGVLVASLLMVYAVLGLAVLHFVTRGMASRGLLLSATYAAVIILGWPMILMSLFGLLDTVIDLRRRFAGSRAPPGPPMT